VNDKNPRNLLGGLALLILGLGLTLNVIERSRDRGQDDPSETESSQLTEEQTDGAARSPGETGSASSTAGSTEDTRAGRTRDTNGADLEPRETSTEGISGSDEGGEPPPDPDPRELCGDTIEYPTMKELDPEDPTYNPKIEARQAFHPMEQTLLEADPLDRQAWRDALSEHKLRNAGVSKRAQFLRQSGYPDAAQDLLEEWGRVYGSWQARAYGRAGPPGHRSATHQP